MPKPLIEDDLWARIEPLLPKKRRRKRYAGRRPLEDRMVLSGILFVLRSGIPWEMLPQEMGCGSGVTCWRRLRDWQEVGVWERLHRELLDRLGDADQIDWDRASLDSASIPAKRGASASAPTRRTAANRARSAMLWEIGEGSRSPAF